MDAFPNPVSIEIENLSFRYPKKNKDIISNLSLTMNSGCAYYLSGENGAGKTTLFKLIVGTMKPLAGNVTIGGCTSGSLEAKELFAYIPQYAVMPGYTKVKSFVRYYCTHFGIPLDKALAAVSDIDCSSKLIELSGGWQRRLLLRLCLLAGKQILILDEPTAGVDLKAQKALWDELAEFVNAGGLLIWADHFDHELLAGNRMPVEVINVGA